MMEANLVVQALRINTLSKLTYVDSKRFDALVKDVFPGVEFRDIEYEHLAKAIEQACEEESLIVNKNQVHLSSLTISFCKQPSLPSPSCTACYVKTCVNSIRALLIG